MSNYFTFASHSSSEWGVGISGSGTFGSPQRDVDTVSIPGRSGDILHDNGRFGNSSVVYPAYIARSFMDYFDDFRAYLMSFKGYQRLEDTYHPNEFRMAAFLGPLEPTPTARNLSGEFEVTFICQPQRWLKSGETVSTFSASGSILNPTYYDAKPLIRVYGTGIIVVNNVSISITDQSAYTDIDCERMDAYEGDVNRNGDIEIEGGEFPVLSPGGNSIILGNSITRVQITPRWFTI